MSIIDNVVAHYEALEQTIVEVPEWETTVYIDPITVKSMGRIAHKIQGGDISAMVDFVIKFALDDKGKNLFDLKDKPILIRKGEVHILDRIVSAAMEAPDEVDAEKN